MNMRKNLQAMLEAGPEHWTTGTIGRPVYGKYCLLGWAYHDLITDDLQDTNKPYYVADVDPDAAHLADVITDLFPTRTFSSNVKEVSWKIVDFNDNEKTTFEDVKQVVEVFLAETAV